MDTVVVRNRLCIQPFTVLSFSVKTGTVTSSYQQAEERRKPGELFEINDQFVFFSAQVEKTFQRRRREAENIRGVYKMDIPEQARAFCNLFIAFQGQNIDTGAGIFFA